MKENWCRRIKRFLSIFISVVAIPLVAIGGSLLFPRKATAWVIFSVSVLSCLPFFLNYEFKKEGRSGPREIAVLAVLIGLSSLGRFAFAWLPGFKPLAAVAILAGINLGRDAGFLVGSLSIVISNFYFGQGPWTGFQMFAFGIIGFLAGVLGKCLQGRRFWTVVYGALSGVLFSLIMDIGSALWMDGAFTLRRYLVLCLSALPFTLIYVVSNVIFLFVLARPVGAVLGRLQYKYGVFR